MLAFSFSKERRGFPKVVRDQELEWEEAVELEILKTPRIRVY
jgi:hypothetical protein